MSINFATMQGLTIPEGVATQIADASGRVLWMLSGGGKVILEVEKVTSNTYAGETTYENEQFILLDIYPKTNGTVSVTYGGLTKTITDTSSAEEPNAQQVYFGTFNGVTDEVETPTSGELIIEGDCAGFGCGSYAKDGSYKKDLTCCCITAIKDVGEVVNIPNSAFYAKPNSSNASALKKVILKEGVLTIGEKAFALCAGLEQMTIPASVKSIPYNTWSDRVNPYTMNGTFLSIDKDNPNYYCEGSCVITKADNKLIFGFPDAVIPQGVKSIGERAFYFCKGMSADFAVPSGVTTIGDGAFCLSDGIVNLTIPSSVTNLDATNNGTFSAIRSLKTVTVLATTPPKVSNPNNTLFSTGADTALVSIVVPKGCSSAYKSATGWSKYASYIVEAS